MTDLHLSAYRSKLKSKNAMYIKLVLLSFIFMNTAFGQIPSSGIDILDHIKSFKYKKINENTFQGTNKSNKTEKCIIIYNDSKIKTIFLFDEQGKVYFYENQNHTEITITTKHSRLNVIINEHKTDSIYKTNFVYPQKN